MGRAAACSKLQPSGIGASQRWSGDGDRAEGGGREPEHPVPRSQSGHVRAHGADHTGEFATEAAHPGHHPESDDDVAEVHSGGAYVDAHLARAERFGEAVGGRHECQVVDGSALPDPVKHPGGGSRRRKQGGVAGQRCQAGHVGGAGAQRQPGFRARHDRRESGGGPVVAVPVDHGDAVGVLVRRGAEEPPHGGCGQVRQRVPVGDLDGSAHQDDEPGGGEGVVGEPAAYGTERPFGGGVHLGHGARITGFGSRRQGSLQRHDHDVGVRGVDRVRIRAARGSREGGQRLGVPCQGPALRRAGGLGRQRYLLPAGQMEPFGRARVGAGGGGEHRGGGADGQ